MSGLCRSGCILFFDEIDALAAAAEGSADEAFQSRISATLATLFDRLSSLAALPGQLCIRLTKMKRTGALYCTHLNCFLSWCSSSMLRNRCFLVDMPQNTS